ncbi:MAG: type IVB secretion system protein IcmW [Gammaproteobacteria bacterium]|nr:type IVB secretion system protein IcmW [Gammaproteobacteria bacterium]
MADLSTNGAHQYWRNYSDSSIYKTLVFMESVENFTLDGDPDLEESLQKLGNVLDEVSGIDLGMQKEFVDICAFIKANRFLLLLQSLDLANPGSASKVIAFAEDNDKGKGSASLFVRRNIVFERLRLLSRVFAKERLELIQKALEAL